MKRCPKCGLELTEQRMIRGDTGLPDWYYCPDCQIDFDVDEIGRYANVQVEGKTK